MKYTVFDYIGLLETGLNYMVEYDKKYNLEMSNINHKRKLEYHIFNFTQILYAIQERLKYDHPESWNKTKEFFEKEVELPKTEIGVIIKMGNKFKHEDGFDLIQHYNNIKKFPDGIHRPTKVSKIIKSKYNLCQRDKSLIQLFTNAYNNVKQYCDELKINKSLPSP